MKEIAAYAEIIAREMKEASNGKNRFPREIFEDPCASIEPCIPLSELCCPSGNIDEDGTCCEE